MFLNRIDFDDTRKRFGEVILTPPPWYECRGELALRRHDLVAEYAGLQDDTVFTEFVADADKIFDKFFLAYPHCAVYEPVIGKGDAAEDLNYLAWVAYHLQANFKQMGSLQISASVIDFDDNVDSVEAIAVGFTWKDDFADFETRFDAKDLSTHPQLGYEQYLADVGGT